MNRRMICTAALLSVVWVSSTPAQEEAAIEAPPLREGAMYRVSSKSSMKGKIQAAARPGDKPKEVAIEGFARVVYRERVLFADSKGGGDRVLRIYETVEYRQTVDGQPREAAVRPEVRRVLFDRRAGRDLIYSPDGLLTGPEVGLLRNDVLIPALTGLWPTGVVKPGAAWKVPADATAELVGVRTLQNGALSGEYLGVIAHKGRRLGQISVEGSAVGTAEDGRSRNIVQGGVYLDEKTGELASLRAVGERVMLSPDDKEIGSMKVEFQFVVQPLEAAEGLSDQDVAKLSEPTESQTRLLFDPPGFGLRFEHGRDWLVSIPRPNEVVLMQKGSSTALQIEPENAVPTGRQYHDRVRKYLDEEKIVPVAETPVEEFDEAGRKLAHFRFDVVLKEKPMVLDYWVVHQGTRGATIMARLLKEDAERFLKEVEHVARTTRTTEAVRPLIPRPVEKSAQ